MARSGQISSFPLCVPVVCACVCFSCLADSPQLGSLCVLIPALPESPGGPSSFPTFFFSPPSFTDVPASFCLFLRTPPPPAAPLSQSCGGSFTPCIQQRSRPGPPPNIQRLVPPLPVPCVALCCCHKAVGPADEVTLHRRAAGLTEPRPSPPPAAASPRTNRPAVPPPPPPPPPSSSSLQLHLFICPRQLHLQARANHGALRSNISFFFSFSEV